MIRFVLCMSSFFPKLTILSFIKRPSFFLLNCPTILLFPHLSDNFTFFRTCLTILLFPHLYHDFTFSTLILQFYFFHTCMKILLFFTIVQQFYFFHIRLDNSIFSTHVWQFFFFHTCLTILLFPHLSSCNKSSSHLLPAQPLLPCRCHLVHQLWDDISVTTMKTYHWWGRGWRGWRGWQEWRRYGGGECYPAVLHVVCFSPNQIANPVKNCGHLQIHLQDHFTFFFQPKNCDLSNTGGEIFC